MRGGGWCAARVSEQTKPPLVILEEDAVDVRWAKAHASVIDSIALFLDVFDHWPDVHRTEIRACIDRFRSLRPGASLQQTFGPAGDQMIYFLVTTPDASRLGATLELVRSTSRGMWFERGVIPTPRSGLAGICRRRDCRRG